MRMSDRNSLIRTIQMYSFTIDELVLYLDTHPNCRNALNHYHKYKKLLQSATKEYNDRFGPLNVMQVSDEDKWSWVQEPWPWERGEN